MKTGRLASVVSTTFVLTICLALLTGCPDRPEPEEPDPQPDEEPAVEEFELVGDAQAGQPHYDAQCASCHGAEGRGDGPAGAALDPPAADLTETELTAEEIYIITRDGGPALGQSPLMAPFDAALDEQELHDVTAYVLELAGRDNPSGEPSSPPSEEGDMPADESDAETDDEVDGEDSDEVDEATDEP